MEFDLSKVRVIEFLIFFHHWQEGKHPHALSKSLLGIVELNLFATCERNLIIKFSGDPGMLQRLLCIIPLNLTYMAQVDDEVLSQLTDVGRKRPLLWLNACYFLFQWLGVVWHDASCNEERMKSNKHGVQSNPCSVYVNFLAVLLTGDLFWCHVESSSNLVLMWILDAHPLLGWKPEVDDL